MAVTINPRKRYYGLSFKINYKLNDGETYRGDSLLNNMSCMLSQVIIISDGS